MGKAQDGSKATEALRAPKKTVSTSRIFKKPRKQPSRKGDPKHQEHAVKPSSRRDAKRSRHKSKVEPDNPIITSWDDCIKKSSDAIEGETFKGLEAVTHELLPRFRQSYENFTQRIEVEAKIEDIVYLPLAEEGMKYASPDGSQTTEDTTLGAQMKRFKKIIAKEEKELQSLMEQWVVVQEELVAVASDILGPDAAKILPSLSEPAIEEMLKDADQKAFEMQYKRFEGLIKTTSEQAVEKMVASEKKLFDDEDEAEDV
ncbi:hypothetical protein G7Y79_00024g056500 [Physcia stellaris]|nr:hypothetical protein G7Y79_00024g056500 [Physcia stellaris]